MNRETALTEQTYQLCTWAFTSSQCYVGVQWCADSFVLLVMLCNPGPALRRLLLYHTHIHACAGQVKDLARLSLRNPEYLAVHAEAAQPTPLRLQQARHSSFVNPESTIVCELIRK